MLVRKYVDQNGSVAKRSVGVAPEVNQESVAPRQRSTQAKEPRVDLTRSPKQGYQWPHKKDCCPPIYYLK